MVKEQKNFKIIQNMKVFIKMINLKVMENWNFQMEIFTKEIFFKENLMERENLYGLMENNMKENGLKIRNLVMGNINYKTILSIKVILWKIRFLGMVFI